MANLDLKIVNGLLATTAGVFQVDIGVTEGRIAALAARGGLGDADEVLEVRDRIIMPGGIDTHVHATDPPLDFGLASQAGALGGVTTIVDMPFQRPLTTDPESFDIKLDSMAPKAYADFALWATCSPEDVKTILPLKDKGVIGYKLVMHQSVSRIMPYHDSGAICDALEEVKKTGLFAVVHAESQEIIHRLEKKLKEEGREDPEAFLDSHPLISELEAVHRIIFLAKHIGARVHIAHCSIAEGIDMVTQARKKGQPVTVETCIHYLVFDHSIFAEKGVLAKIAPPLRDRKHVDMMWQKIRDGQVDNVSSDHVPYRMDFKRGHIWQASAGAGGIQTMFPLLITEGIKKNRINLSQMVKVMSEGPAKVCGIYPKKGCAMVGADADFAVFDLKREREVRVEEQVGLEWSLYEGMKAVYPDTVLVRGRPVVREGEIVGKAGYGELCVPSETTGAAVI